ncbi:MAG: DUF2779 domain-containing protein [Candidatus Woesearchaeota archaeon]
MKKLSKSLFMKGRRCHRLLWMSAHDKLPSLTLSDKHKINQGARFEQTVHKLFPQAINMQTTTLTLEEALETKKPLLEATFETDQFLVRTDILIPNGSTWDLAEIKASTRVKPEHYEDLAFQKHVLEQNGFTISRLLVYTLDKEYVKQGLVKPEQLITTTEVNEQASLEKNIAEDANTFFDIINQDKPPEITISKNCNNPSTCPLKDECWGTLPEHNVLHLKSWRTYWKLLEQGITDLKDVPEDAKFSEKDTIILQAQTQSPQLQTEQLQEFINNLTYPLYHFDFETFDTAIPIYDNSRPYQKIPFQYSLHIQHREQGTESNAQNSEPSTLHPEPCLTHKEFLAEGNEDPRPELLKRMREDLKGTGDIIVFNKNFEVGILKQLAKDFPEHKDWIQELFPRIKDLADPFKNFHYYDKSQKGSYSIKKVLPALTTKNYDELDITNGGDASAQYFYSHIQEELHNKDEIREHLLTYCGLDTEGMVWILQGLMRAVK